jgi:hypothetical protein
MVPPDLFSDRLRDTVRDALPVYTLGTVEGGHADLIGQYLPGNPSIKSCAKCTIEYCRKDRPGGPVRPGTGLTGIEGRTNAFARPKR